MMECFMKMAWGPWQVDPKIFLHSFENWDKPYCKLHETYIHYTKVKNVLYVNDCQDKEPIIPVTLFLTMSFNACFTYQKSKASNMFVDALDTFNLNTTLDDDTFMNTVSTLLHTNFSTLEYFASYDVLTTYLLNCFIDELSFYLCNIGCVIATLIAKRPFQYTNRGQSLMFHEFIQSWVGYELVKVFRAYGLQPRSLHPKLKQWSPY